MNSKVCKKCGIDQSLDNFYRDRNRPDGYYPWCKSCKSVSDHAHYERSAEVVIARSHAYYHANRINILVKERLDRELHQAAHHDAWQKRYNANPEKHRAHSRQWYHANLDKARLYRTNNRECLTALERIRRTRKKAVGGTISAAEWRAVLDFYGNKCLHCGVSEALTMDHVIPISQGGAHCLENVQPLCRKCNSSKHVSRIDYRNGRIYHGLAHN